MIEGRKVKGEFSRGWKVLLGSFIGMGVSIVSLSYYAGGIWVKPWQDAFGWSRTEIGTGQSLSTLVIVLTAPFAGRLIDRYGLRSVATVSLFLYGLVLWTTSQMTGSLWMFYSLMILTTLVGVASSPIAFTRAINGWFNKHRGLALGLSLTSTGVVAFLIPRYLTPYVATEGWRSGFFVLFCIVMIAVPIVWLLIRDQPEGRGDMDDAKKVLSGATFKEATKTRTFWTMSILFFLIAFAVLGLIPSFIPLLQDAGFTPAKAGAMAGIMGLSVMIGRIITGLLVDRIFAPYVTAVIFTLVAFGCLALGLGGIDYALPAAIALGMAIGAEADLIGFFTARYFGLKNYGTIYGFQYSMFSLGAATSPIVAGYIWDVTGDYDVALIGASILLGISVIIALTLPRFKDEITL